jgi:hypothetical protein
VLCDEGTPLDSVVCRQALLSLILGNPGTHYALCRVGLTSLALCIPSADSVLFTGPAPRHKVKVGTFGKVTGTTASPSQTYVYGEFRNLNGQPFAKVLEETVNQISATRAVKNRWHIPLITSAALPTDACAMVSALEIIAHTYAFRITPEMIEAFGPVLRGVTLVTSESRLPCWTEIAENIYGEHVADYSSLLWGFIARHYSMPQLGPLQCYSTDEDLGDKEDVSSVDIEHTR